jgi:hypothetical protein
MASLKIPAYLEDVRSATIAELKSDSDRLHANREDRDMSARILQRSTRLLDQVLTATGEVTVTADQLANPRSDGVGSDVKLAWDASTMASPRDEGPDDARGVDCSDISSAATCSALRE